MLTGLEDMEHTMDLYLDSHDSESRITFDNSLVVSHSTSLYTRSTSETMSLPSASSIHSSFPAGTIAALVLAGVLAIIIVIVILFYFLHYRPRNRRLRQQNIPQPVEEAKGDVLNISAESPVVDRRSSRRIGMTQWADEMEGKSSHGWRTLAHLGLAFKKGSSSGNGDGYETPLSSESVRSTSPQAPTSKGKKSRLWKSSWTSYRPSHSIELQTTRSSSTEDTKSISDGVSSLYFAPLVNGVPQEHEPITLTHPYSTTGTIPQKSTLPQFSIQPPTPLVPTARHSTQATDYTSSRGLHPAGTKGLRSVPRGGIDDGSATNLDGTKDCTAVAVRSLSPRTSEVASVESKPERPFLEVKPTSPFSFPLALVEADEIRPKRLSGLSVRFREGDVGTEGKGKARADDSELTKASQPSSSRRELRSAVKATREAVTSFLDLGGSSREGSSRSSASSSQKRHLNLPIPAQWTRNGGSSTDLRSGWSSSTPSGAGTAEDSPVEPETSRWSSSAPSGISENQIHGTSSDDISSSSQSSNFPYPLSLPPPHHPEHITRRQPPARLLDTLDPARGSIPSNVFSASSQSSQFSPSEVHFRHSFSDETDHQHTFSGLQPHPPLPNLRPVMTTNDSYIIQHVLGRHDAATSP